MDAVQAIAKPAAKIDDPDETIVERVRGGETELYEVLIRRHNQRLYRVARAILREDAAVEDVMQEAYLKAFTGLSRFEGRALFSTWLTRILINCALAHLRSRARRTEVALELVDETKVAGADDAAPRAGESIAREQVGRLIEKAVDELPAKYRVVFVMREVEERTVAETAACLGISPVNTKVRLHRAKKLLRGVLSRQVPDIFLYSFLGPRCDELTKRVMEKIASLYPGTLRPV